MKFVDDHLTVKVVEIDQELVGMFSLDPKWFRAAPGKCFRLYVTTTSQGVFTAAART